MTERAIFDATSEARLNRAAAEWIMGCKEIGGSYYIRDWQVVSFNPDEYLYFDEVSEWQPCQDLNQIRELENEVKKDWKRWEKYDNALNDLNIVLRCSEDYIYDGLNDIANLEAKEKLFLLFKSVLTPEQWEILRKELE